jgi:hypothetical protein
MGLTLGRRVCAHAGRAMAARGKGLRQKLRCRCVLATREAARAALFDYWLGSHDGRWRVRCPIGRRPAARRPPLPRLHIRSSGWPAWVFAEVVPRQPATSSSSATPHRGETSALQHRGALCSLRGLATGLPSRFRSRPLGRRTVPRHGVEASWAAEGPVPRWATPPRTDEHQPRRARVGARQASRRDEAVVERDLDPHNDRLAVRDVNASTTRCPLLALRARTVCRLSSCSADAREVCAIALRSRGVRHERAA